MSQQQPSIETVWERTIKPDSCLLCHNEIYKVILHTIYFGNAEQQKNMRPAWFGKFYGRQIKLTSIKNKPIPPLLLQNVFWVRLAYQFCFTKQFWIGCVTLKLTEVIELTFRKEENKKNYKYKSNIRCFL